MENKGKVRTNYVAENLLEAALWIEVQELGRK
jgi:hypothetical protein